MKPIFEKSDWKKIEKTYDEWWKRELERPVLNLRFWGEDPKMERPSGLITEEHFHLMDDPAMLIAEKMDYNLRCFKYAADGFPYVWIYLGPIFAAEYFGAHAIIANSTVWYKPDEYLPADKIKIGLDKNSIFYPRTIELYKAFRDYFQGSMAISSPSAFCFDYLAMLMDTEELSCNFYDMPNEVRARLDEIYEVCKNIKADLSEYASGAAGYTHWGGLYAPKMWDSMQCDYCAFISPAHFKEFVLPDLIKVVNDSPDYNYYHLDGEGELCHLDMLLSIENLKCIQWVASPGFPNDTKGWEVYKRISDAGKNIWYTGSLESIEVLIDKLGTSKGIYWHGGYHISEYDKIMKYIERF